MQESGIVTLEPVRGIATSMHDHFSILALLGSAAKDFKKVTVKTRKKQHRINNTVSSKTFIQYYDVIYALTLHCDYTTLCLFLIIDCLLESEQSGCIRVTLS